MALVDERQSLFGDDAVRDQWWGWRCWGKNVSCVIGKNSLSPDSTYAFELAVTDNATSPETEASVPSVTVFVATIPTAPAVPQLSAAKLDVNQGLNVTDAMPSNGTAPYAWSWLISTEAGPFVATTLCAVGSGSGASAGAGVTCAISPGELSVGDQYEFELQINDSGSPPESRASAASAKVTVESSLSAPGVPSVSTTQLKVHTTLTVTAKVNDSTNWAPFHWDWLVSVNGGSYVAASQCASSNGTANHGNVTVTCSITGGTLTVGDTYTFELMLLDSASVPEVATSSPSSTVTVDP